MKENKIQLEDKEQQVKEREDLIEGRNAVIEVLKCDRTIE